MGSRTVDAYAAAPVLLAALAVIAGFALLDVFLVRIARQHRIDRGQWLSAQAEAAMKEERHGDAVRLFRAAQHQDLSNPEYELGLVRALRAQRRSADARNVGEELLRRSPTFGPANAEMARILAGMGLWEESAWYYHRALYGQWKGPADLRALRFELAELLARHGARAQLMSEVILLSANPEDESEIRRLARLQLAANAWDLAERSYTALLRKSRSDPGLMIGLARAQFGAGKYVAAERTFRRAVSAGAGGTAALREFELAARVNALDPTRRGLDARERHRRSHEIAAMIVAAVEGCAPENDAVIEAKTVLDAHQRVRNAGAAAEADQTLVETLWSARQELCGGEPETAEEARLVAEQILR